MRAGARLAAWAAALVLAPATTRAYFESSPAGARAMGLGNAFVCVADDASAVYWNPAGLVQLHRHEILAAYDHLAELGEVYNGFTAIAFHTPVAVFGVGWQHSGLDDALHEDVFYLSAGRTLVKRSLGAFIAGGATLKLAHLGLDTGLLGPIPGLETSATSVTGDLGLMLAPIPNVSVGAALRNLAVPEFDLSAGGEETAMLREIEWGVSLRWRQDAWLHFTRLDREGGPDENRLGAELRLASALGIRAGLSRDEVSAGVEVSFGRLRLDTAFRTTDALGVTYRFGLRCSFGPPHEGVGGTYDEF